MFAKLGFKILIIRITNTPIFLQNSNAEFNRIFNQIETYPLLTNKELL